LSSIFGGELTEMCFNIWSLPRPYGRLKAFTTIYKILIFRFKDLNFP
jgi:hypothetical protein